MAKTTMCATNFFKMAKVLDSDISIMIRANHGVGKSQMIAQLADFFRERDFNGEGFPLIDRRLSQLVEGDVLGLPYTDGKITIFNLPDWVQQACDEPVCLFLDELNRASHEVQAIAFELALDRSIQGRKLHPKTRIYTAVNVGASYVINEMDPALLDRFWTVDLEPTVEEWLDWAKTDNRICYLIRDFIRTNEKFLDPHKDTEPGRVSTSRRSWHRLSRALVLAGLDETPEDPMFYMICLGFIGTEASIAFHDYTKNIEKQVSGEDIFNKLVKNLGKHEAKYTGFVKTDENADKKDKEGKLMWDDAKYDEKFIKRVTSMGQERMVGLSEKVADAMKKIVEESEKKTLTSMQGTALGKFMSLIPAELRISLWGKLTENNDNIELIKVIHKYTVGHILSVFGVPLDSDGSVQPQIPDFLNNDKK